MGGIPVGPFDLSARIGRGGTGEVWLAAHIDGSPDDPPVAIKVLTDHAARDPEYVQAFKREVELASRLDHPHILLVHDFGEIPAEAEQRSHGKLKAGSPWLAMELAEGGHVGERIGTYTWRELRWILQCVLDALAHAHARGVVHRDVKPENVLLAEGGVKVSDFGLAHAGGNIQHHHAGTPHFMAPEQIEGRWRDWGPWTDLYAVGCLAWTLVCGKPPFHAAGLTGALDAHLGTPPPELVPLLPVPEGFEAWLLQLLAKDPLARYRRAADANWALLAMAEPVEGPAGELEETTLSITPMSTLELTWEGESRDGPHLHTVDEVVQRSDIAPFAATWRRPAGREAPPRLAGVGLGLWSLRHIPLVGHEALRDRLWEQLGEARRGTRLVVLRGDVGVGKRRVARWLSERAHALGAAHVLAAVLADKFALPEMLASSLLCPSLKGAELRERVAGMLRRLGSDEAAAEDVAQLIEGRPQPAGVRYQRIQEHIAGLARYRPVLLRLEKLHLSMDGLGLVAQLLYGERQPLLILATVSDAQLRERPVEASVLERLLEHPRATTERIGPLDADGTSQLVRQLLGLRGELAERIEARCEGNPMVAVQIVNDWVERGVLVPTPAGFRLRGGEDAELPEDLHRMWRERTDRFLEGRPETEAHMLELAAVLGVRVDTRLWRQVCRAAGLQVSLRFVESLVGQGLAEAPEAGPAFEWSFAHNTLQESLVRRAREQGRHRRWNLLVARVLEHTGGDDGLRGRHLMWAGAGEAAMRPLLFGATAWAESGHVDDAAQALEERDSLMRRLRIPEGDPRWGQGWAARAATALHAGDREAAEAWVARLLEASEDHGWSDLLAEAERVRDLLKR